MLKENQYRLSRFTLEFTPESPEDYKELAELISNGTVGNDTYTELLIKNPSLDGLKVLLPVIAEHNPGLGKIRIDRADPNELSEREMAPLIKSVTAKTALHSVQALTSKYSILDVVPRDKDPGWRLERRLEVLDKLESWVRINQPHVVSGRVRDAAPEDQVNIITLVPYIERVAKTDERITPEVVTSLKGVLEEIGQPRARAPGGIAPIMDGTGDTAELTARIVEMLQARGLKPGVAWRDKEDSRPPSDPNEVKR